MFVASAREVKSGMFGSTRLCSCQGDVVEKKFRFMCNDTRQPASLLGGMSYFKLCGSNKN